MPAVLIRIVSSSERQRGGAVAGPLAATLRPLSAAKRTVLATSSALSTKATALGRRSAARFQASARLVPVGVARGGDPALDRELGEVGHCVLLGLGSASSGPRRLPPHQDLADHIRAGRGRGRRRRGRPRGGRRAPPGRRPRRGSRRSRRRRGCGACRRSSTSPPRRARVERRPKAKSSSGTGALSALDRLARVGDHDEALGGRGDDLLAQVGAAAALDQPAVGRHLVGAVDRDVEPRAAR